LGGHFFCYWAARHHYSFVTEFGKIVIIENL
jgi:hypothetical protein